MIKNLLLICVFALFLSGCASSENMQGSLLQEGEVVVDSKERSQLYPYHSDACNTFFTIATECSAKSPPALADELKQIMNDLHEAEKQGVDGVLSAERKCNMMTGGFVCPF